MELFLFTTDVVLARRAEEAGVDGLIVDWESAGKEARQTGRDLEINADSLEDLERVAAAVRLPVMVRINALELSGEDEIPRALDGGAGMLMLPMARSAAEVARFVEAVAGRAKTIVQIETQSLVDDVERLRDLAWDYAFIGLNDLMLSRGSHWLWEPVLDGTIESLFGALPGRAVGFGGVTIVGGGAPIPFHLLLHEMVRLGCRLSFLRRTFKKEIMDRDLAAEVRAIRAACAASRQRGTAAVTADRRALVQHLTQLRDRRSGASGCGG